MSDYLRYLLSLALVFAVISTIIDPGRTARAVGHAVHVFREEIAPTPCPAASQEPAR